MTAGAAVVGLRDEGGGERPVDDVIGGGKIGWLFTGMGGLGVVGRGDGLGDPRDGPVRCVVDGENETALIDALLPDRDRLPEIFWKNFPAVEPLFWCFGSCVAASEARRVDDGPEPFCPGTVSENLRLSGARCGCAVVGCAGGGGVALFAFVLFSVTWRRWWSSWSSSDSRIASMIMSCASVDPCSLPSATHLFKIPLPARSASPVSS